MKYIYLWKRLFTLLSIMSELAGWCVYLFWHLFVLSLTFLFFVFRYLNMKDVFKIHKVFVLGWKRINQFNFYGSFHVNKYRIIVKCITVHCSILFPCELTWFHVVYILRFLWNYYIDYTFYVYWHTYFVIQVE